MASGAFGSFMSGIGAAAKSTAFRVGTAIGLSAVAIFKAGKRAGQKAM